MNKPVILKLEGGLGNQLFEFAAGYYLAAKLDTALILDQYGIPLTNHKREPGLSFGEYIWPLINGKNDIETLPETMNGRVVDFVKNHKTFERLVLKYRMHKSNIFHLPIFRETEYDADFFQIAESVKLHGNFQSWRIVEEAAKYGFPKVFSIKKPSDWVSKFIQNNDLKNSLAIHFRLGQDAIDNVEFSQPSIDYYLRAVEYLAFQSRKENIFIFSDNIPLAKERYEKILGRNCIYVNPPISESAAQKQFLLSQFGTIVCANSTFCSWAGWSISNNGGRVVVPIPFSDSVKRGSREFPAAWDKLSKTSGEVDFDYP